MSKSRPIAYVEWVDSAKFSTRVWNDAEDVSKAKLAVCRSVGYVIHEDKESITIAAHAGYDFRDVSGDMKIPKAAITKRRRVKI
mgnify:CR=1 FL=1